MYILYVSIFKWRILRLGGKEAWRPTHLPDFFCTFHTNIAMANLGLKKFQKSFKYGFKLKPSPYFEIWR